MGTIQLFHRRSHGPSVPYLPPPLILVLPFSAPQFLPYRLTTLIPTTLVIIITSSVLAQLTTRNYLGY